MKRLSVFLYSSILNKKIYDEFDDVLGILKDVYVTTEDGYPRIIGYKIKRDGSLFDYEFRNVDVYLRDSNKIRIETRGSKEILPRKYTYLLTQNLLDKKIVDINGKKVVRVNDLRIAEIAGEYRVVAVEAGQIARYRRIGLESFGKVVLKFMKQEPTDQALMWDDVETLELINDSLQLSVPYKKLSNLHPADLADILEELDDKQRKQVFENLDDDLVADALEEIEPEFKGSIIRDLSVSKTAEILENMPNDEIADLLDELNEEEREKILVSLESEDAEEVKELLGYEDETVGSIMNKDFISFNIDVTIEETIDLLREMQPDEEVMHCVYITDENEKLQGAVNIRQLVMNVREVKLQDIMDRNTLKFKHDFHIEDAIELITKYDLLSVPVVDEEDKLVGIVLIHDIVDEFLLPIWRKKAKKAV
ncbi:magnesium transporter [Clostridium folliculivorans]|uniref:Membrane protein n=1 Tax=Clostridium folliculivorans TaxID=2886038 RepID=A0A9W5Y5K3_9CLOT|nr:CBS domain-containing protein [Clostridium folliculivorans]GKU27141.1 membrane protein [Clostridium folliculivorans]GKU31758.1 membrane protein [Clostridium folliculivorans]